MQSFRLHFASSEEDYFLTTTARGKAYATSAFSQTVAHRLATPPRYTSPDATLYFAAYQVRKMAVKIYTN